MGQWVDNKYWIRVDVHVPDHHPVCSDSTSSLKKRTPLGRIKSSPELCAAGSDLGFCFIMQASSATGGLAAQPIKCLEICDVTSDVSVSVKQSDLFAQKSGKGGANDGSHDVPTCSG